MNDHPLPDVSSVHSSPAAPSKSHAVSNHSKPPIHGMSVVPLNIDDSFASWWACVTHAMAEKSMRDQFRLDTGWDVESLLIRTPIETLVDKSTGYETMLMLHFFDWVTVHLWGEEGSEPPIRT